MNSEGTLSAQGDLVIRKRGKMHDLKCWPRPFADSKAGFKMFEVRLDDRGYEVDDILLLREWDPDTQLYTGQQLYRRVIHIEHLHQWLDHDDHAVVMGLEVVE